MTVHANYYEKKEKCTICAEKFLTEAALKNHMTYVHQSKVTGSNPKLPNLNKDWEFEEDPLMINSNGPKKNNNVTNSAKLTITPR